jgi:hypothetical protein
MLEGDLISSLLFCPCYYSRLLREKWPKLFHETLEDINKDANNDWGQLLANLIDTPETLAPNARNINRLEKKIYVGDRVAKFFLAQTYQNGENIPNDRKLYLPNSHKLDLLDVKYSKWS